MTKLFLLYLFAFGFHLIKYTRTKCCTVHYYVVFKFYLWIQTKMLNVINEAYMRRVVESRFITLQTLFIKLFEWHWNSFAFLQTLTVTLHLYNIVGSDYLKCYAVLINIHDMICLLLQSPESEERTPGRLQAVWPPPKPIDKEEKIGLKYTEAGKWLPCMRMDMWEK